MCGTKRLTQFFRLLEASEVQYFRSAQLSLLSMGVGRGARTPWILKFDILYYIFSKKGRFFGFREGKMKFHQICPHWKNCIVGKIR